MSTEPKRIHRAVPIPIEDVDPKSSFLVSSGDCIQMDTDFSDLTVKLDNIRTTGETAMIKYHPLSAAGNLVVHSVGTQVVIHGMQIETHLNGQTGRIVNIRYLLERYFVKIDDMKNLICVPFQNVRAVRHVRTCKLRMCL